jgi:outer membrane lipoprotein carrier protein
MRMEEIMRSCLHTVRYVIFFVAVSLILPFPAGAADGVPLSKLRAVYKNLRTLEGRFTQVTYIKDLDKKETFKGIFYLKIPDRMRWKYTEGSTDEVYLTGKEMVIDQPSESQVFISSMAGYGLSSSPLRILLDLDELENNFNLKSRRGHIFMTPKGKKTVVDSIELVLSENKFPLEKIRFLDRYANRTEITLIDVKINTVLKDSLFLFTPPAGTAIIRQ